jgi:hypothetical protein
LWRYFHIVQYLCKLVHARRDREWERELDRDVFGDDYVDTPAEEDD